MKIVNLTPHALNFISQDGAVTIPPSGTVARVSVTRETIGTVVIDGVSVPVNRTVYGAVEGLPDPAPDTIYVVSTVVAQAVTGRDDIYIVDDLVRDDQGRVVGAKGLATVARPESYTVTCAWCGSPHSGEGNYCPHCGAS